MFIFYYHNIGAHIQLLLFILIPTIFVFRP